MNADYERAGAPPAASRRGIASEKYAGSGTATAAQVQQREHVACHVIRCPVGPQYQVSAGRDLVQRLPARLFAGHDDMISVRDPRPIALTADGAGAEDVSRRLAFNEDQRCRRPERNLE
jgi:hypothetical protein